MFELTSVLPHLIILSGDNHVLLKPSFCRTHTRSHIDMYAQISWMLLSSVIWKYLEKMSSLAFKPNI